MGGSEHEQRSGEVAKQPAALTPGLRRRLVVLGLLLLATAAVVWALWFRGGQGGDADAQPWAPGELPAVNDGEPDPDVPTDPGGTGSRFNALSERRAAGDRLTARQADEVARLRALGYAAGSTAGRGSKGVTVHDRSRAHRGVNLYIDGHAPAAFLMDMDGRVLHRWQHDFASAFPGRGMPEGTADTGFYRRVHLFDDGALLAIFEGQGMIKLDRDSRLLWAYPAGTHHDMHVMDDGTIYVLARHTQMARRISPQHPILHDTIDILSPDGKRTGRVSLLSAIENSRFSSVLQRLHVGGDIFHTNTLEILDGRFADRMPAFAAGNALVSILNLDMVAVVDMKLGVVVWAMDEGWHRQHEPTVLDSGNLMVFDNGRTGFSRVVEVDPVTRKLLWSYGGPDVDFYSRTCGTAQRLPNGNTLITETDQGRAFEVLPDTTIVWEFHTPHRAGDEGELIASLFQVQRLPAGFGLDWARAPAELE